MTSMDAYDPDRWTDLLVASAGASAALTGLVFVAVSINLERILALASLPDRAFETLMLLLGVVIVSILGLIPGQGATAFGVELIAFTLLTLAMIVALLVRDAPLPPEARRAVRFAVVVAGTLPFLVAGVSLIAGAGGGLVWVAAGIVGAIAGGVMNAWVLLVEIQR
jgi:hypothetical protein